MRLFGAGGSGVGMSGELELIGWDGRLAEIFAKALAPVIERLASGTAHDISFCVPISKVDPQSRTIEGIAQAEVLDASNEIISYAASKEAFANLLASAGKIPIREMHAPIAAGKSVGVSYDDRAKTVTLKARISRGAESTWTKILDGTLSMLSISGQRLRSEIRADGVRWTSQIRLAEVSVVDLGSNPACKFSIVKSVNGVPVATDLVAAANEADYFLLADAVDAVAIQLRAGCRPLPQEVTKAFNLAGSAVVCDILAPDDFGQRGPGIAADLKACSTALRGCIELADLEKARTAAVFVLSVLPCRRDLARAREKGHRSGTWNAEGRGRSVESLREEIAKCLGQLRGMQGSAEAVETLEKNVMQVQGIAAIAGGMGKSLFTAQELAEMRDKLAGQLNEWHAKGWAQNVPEYRRLSDTYFLVSQKLKGK